MDFNELALIGFFSVLAYLFYRNKKRNQLDFIQEYRFNSAIGRKVQQRYPHLNEQQISLVLTALKDYFLLCHQAKRRTVSMPSQVVDAAWHEFILFTRHYQSFSQKALGRFLHHTPTEAMSTPTQAQDGIKRAWRLACAKEKINPQHPTRLPLLFSIDADLGIKDGFRYSLNCKDKTSPAYGDGYCASHIGCASGCSGDSGSSSSSGGFFDGDSGSSGDGGGGCGGD
ncbi:MAG: hypothetical protein CMI09_11930 [Oceanospirillaceae bacterium]|nr:hypothetical protein [Oceanospirillaceae bacterium]